MYADTGMLILMIYSQTATFKIRIISSYLITLNMCLGSLLLPLEILNFKRTLPSCLSDIASIYFFPSTLSHGEFKTK